MDFATMLATFPAEVREEVLLTSDESMLSTLTPALLAEAQVSLSASPPSLVLPFTALLKFIVYLRYGFEGLHGSLCSFPFF